MSQTQFPVRPLNDKLIVLPDKAPDRTASGLFLPGTVSTATKTGTVIVVSTGKQTAKGVVPLNVKPGERVFFGEYAGVELKLGDGNVYLMMKEEEVMGVLVPDPSLPTNDPSIFQKNIA